jgi:hypothetical protein
MKKMFGLGSLAIICYYSMFCYFVQEWVRIWGVGAGLDSLDMTFIFYVLLKDVYVVGGFGPQGNGGHKRLNTMIKLNITSDNHNAPQISNIEVWTDDTFTRFLCFPFV